jgi:hypothetical protein
MKPSESKVIITGGEWNHPDGSRRIFLDVVEMGQIINSSALNWLFKLHLKTQIPLRIQINRGHNWYGPKEFFEATK